MRLLWLPIRAPELNPMDTLWGQAKDVISANKQYATVDEQVGLFISYLISGYSIHAGRLQHIPKFVKIPMHLREAHRATSPWAKPEPTILWQCNRHLLSILQKLAGHAPV